MQLNKHMEIVKNVCVHTLFVLYRYIYGTLKVENFAGTKFRGSKKPRNFCVSQVLNFAVVPSK